MLRGMHKASSTWLGKGLMAGVMGLITISFAIWGIGDIFRGFGLNSVAKIGGTEIGIEQFRQYYSEKLSQLSQQARRPITPDQARALGIDRQLVGQLIAETALDEQARQLHLGASNETVADRIRSDPAFRGPTGKFDRNVFARVIQQANYSEPRFVEEQRKLMLRRQIAQSVGGNIKVPAIVVGAANQFQSEKRNIAYVIFGAAQAGDVPPPTPEVLTKYFDDRKTLFRAPEYRKVTLLAVSPASLAKPDQVSDADAKSYFEQNKDKFGKPEQREVQQIVFPKPEDAAAAADRIAKGLSFDDLAKERGLKSTDTDIGLVTKSAIIDPAIAEAVFNLQPNVVSAPIKGAFGTVLARVTKVVPGEQKTFEEVKPQIKEQLAEAHARTEIGNLRDKIEDERAAGSTLAETAKKFGLTTQSIDAIDRSGRAPDGKEVPSLPKGVNVIGPVFASDVGVDNDALQLPNGGLLWYDVTGITPSRDRTLDEVKDQVEARWRDDEIAKRLQTKADDFIAKHKSGGDMQQLAADAKLTVEVASNLQRGKKDDKIPAQVLGAIFRTAKGNVGSAAGEKETERFVFRVTDVVDPMPNEKSVETQNISNALQNSYTDDLLGEYLARLESELGVTINQAALNQVIGGGAPQ